MNRLKHALRQLVKRPGLSLAMILMLSLGIGATTAIFSVFHQMLVQPLPIPKPERLVNLAGPGPQWGANTCSNAGTCDRVFSYPMYRDLAARQSVFAGLAAHRDFTANVSSTRGPARVANGILVSGSYFSVLGVAPADGRLIGPDDEPKIGEGAVVVLSYDYWQSAFGGAPDAIGRSLTVNGQQLTIVGVAPRGFAGTILGFRPQVFVPLTLRWLMEPQRPRDEEDRRSHWVYLFARLAPGIRLEQATAGINALYGGILNEVEAPAISNMPADLMEQFRQRQIIVEPGPRGNSMVVLGADRALMLLLGITTLVLLIVCFNVANLLLARGVARAGELAVRASIGASRRRLVLESLLDAAAPAIVGALLSLPVAALTLRVIGILVPTRLADGLALHLNSTALLFAAAASLVTVLLFGSAPAVQVTRTDPCLAMKGHAAQSLGAHGMARLRNGLATTQVAFSMLLLVLAGLFAQSLANVARVDLGFDTDSIVTFSASPRMNGATPEAARLTFERIEERLAAQPGVTSVGSARIALLTGRGSSAQPAFEGTEAVAGTPIRSMSNEVDADFFTTLSIPLLAGRRFTDADDIGRPPVAIVNESFVRQYGLGADALGKRFSLGSRLQGVEIVGIVADSQYRWVKGEVGAVGEVPAQLFLPHRQDPNLDGLTFYLRSAGAVDALQGAIPSVVTEIDPNLAVGNLTTFRTQIDENVFLDRLVATLATGFAALATLLAALGLYGVLSYGVAQRTRELGLRSALGATPRQLRGLVVKQVGVMASVGGVLGLAAALALGRFAEALLFGLSGHDPVVLVAAVAALTVVVLGAAYLPARRATAVDPLAALRYE
jgi:putative ABC transport system permease protein